MRAFVIRPFGTKCDIDFDQVEHALIQPALALLGPDMQVAGSTTALITKQGGIREDMFRLIAVADLVIADISIHNANVFYELGMRHALRPRHTFMVRCVTNQPHPFDLQTDRYFTYDAANPQARVADLAAALRSTLASENSDSPMFSLLPQLVPHGRGRLVSVPVDFREAVDAARVVREYGKLRLYADEVRAFEWDQEGLRLIGDAQFKLRAYAGARDTFELLRQADASHLHANLRLGTIYQRLSLSQTSARKAELMNLSTQAIERVIAAAPARVDLVEAHCLLASNHKSRWIDEMAGLTPPQQQAVTLRSTHFDRMLASYLRASNLDLNAHYPAINALAGLKIRLACARALPQAWLQIHDDEAAAAAALAAIERLAGRMASTLHLALELDDLMGKRPGPADDWAAGSRADFMLLTAPERAERVAQCYRDALTGSDWFALEATRRNIDIYQKLGMFEPGVSAALAEIDSAMAAAGPLQTEPVKVLVFTGHMVDAAGKAPAQARFPRTATTDARARALIREAVSREVGEHAGTALGIAGGACGGDILFHEVCAELGVPTLLLLALPVTLFEASSVQQGGAGWVERYRALTRQLPTSVLQPAEAFPNWLKDKKNYNVWERANLWMMFSAMSQGACDLTLLALYNPDRDADGPGGTAHLLNVSKDKGFKVVELDARVLLE